MGATTRSDRGLGGREQRRASRCGNRFYHGRRNTAVSLPIQEEQIECDAKEQTNKYQLQSKILVSFLLVQSTERFLFQFLASSEEDEESNENEESKWER